MEEPSIKPIGFKPDGSHMNKGAVALVICILIAIYCIFSPAPFGNEKITEKVTTTEKK